MVTAALVRAGAGAQVDVLLADLQLLGLRLAAPGDGHADLVRDTATALKLVAGAARDGIELDCTDALCTAVAIRLGLLLLTADPSRHLPTSPNPRSDAYHISTGEIFCRPATVPLPKGEPTSVEDTR